MKTTSLIKTRTRTSSASGNRGLEALDVSKTTIVVVGGIPAVIGIWAVACFVSGLITSGGPIAMARAWITAVTGI